MVQAGIYFAKEYTKKKYFTMSVTFSLITENFPLSAIVEYFTPHKNQSKYDAEVVIFKHAKGYLVI